MPEPKIAAKEDETQDHAFLGREFLTWLLWRADRGEGSFTDENGEFSIGFGGRVRLSGTGSDVTDAVLRGRSPGLSVETRAGLGAGRTLRARLKVDGDDRLAERMTLLEELEGAIEVRYLFLVKERTRAVWDCSIDP